MEIGLEFFSTPTYAWNQKNPVTKKPLIIIIHLIEDIFIVDLVRYKTPEEEAKHLQTSFLSSKDNVYSFAEIQIFLSVRQHALFVSLENKSLISMGI